MAGQPGQQGQTVRPTNRGNQGRYVGNPNHIAQQEAVKNPNHPMYLNRPTNGVVMPPQLKQNQNNIGGNSIGGGFTYARPPSELMDPNSPTFKPGLKEQWLNQNTVKGGGNSMENYVPPRMIPGGGSDLGLGGGMPPPGLGFDRNGNKIAPPPEYLTGFTPPSMNTADSRMYTLNGEQKMGSSSYIGALSKHLESIGQGDLLKGGTYTPTQQAGIPGSQNPTTPPIRTIAPPMPQPTDQGGGNAYPGAVPSTIAPQAPQPNINQMAISGLKAAGAGTAAGMAYTPSQVGVAGTSASINPTNVIGSNVNPALNNVSGTNVAGSNIAAQNIGQQALTPQVQAQMMRNTSMTPYMNPYDDAVVKANETDILRGANMGLDMLGAQAQAAGGFGGSRHGIAMGEMGRGVAQQLAQSSAGLRQAGFQNAQAMAGQDIANNFNSQMANQAGSQFDINTNMQGALANQGAGLQASQANQQNALQAAGMNQQNALQAQGMNQQYGMQGQLANQGNAMQAGLANQSANMQGQMANQSAGMQDIQNRLQASLANQNAGLQGNQLRLGAANQMGQLSNLGFGMGQTVNNNLAMQGAQQQAMQQALFQAAQAQFQGFKNQGANSIGYVNQALGQTPNVGTNTTQETKQNGIFDYLTAMTNSYSGGR